MEMRRFSVIGAGQMGSGIAQVAAQSGLEVVLARPGGGAGAEGMRESRN